MRWIPFRTSPLNQPQGRVYIDWDNPITKGLIGVFVPGHAVNIVDGVLLERTGFAWPTLGAGPRGREIQANAMGYPAPTSASSTYAKFDVNVGTAFALCRQRVATNTGVTFGRYNGSSSPTWSIGLHGGSVNGVHGNWGTFTYTPSGTTLTTTGNHAVTISGDGSTARIYENGRQVSSGAYSPATTQYDAANHRKVYFGPLSGGFNNTETYPSLCLFWTRALSAAEVANISANPWQVFRSTPTFRIATYSSSVVLVSKNQVLGYNINASVLRNTNLSYSIRQASSKFTSLSYNIRQSATSNRSFTYNIRALVNKTQTVSYNVRTFSFKSIAITYSIRTSIPKNFGLNYFIRTDASKNQSINYLIRLAALKNSSINYDIRALVPKNTTFSYNIRQSLNKNQPITYFVRDVVNKNQNISYLINNENIVLKSFSINYNIRTAASKSNTFTYSIRQLVSKNGLLEYNIRLAVSADKQLSYNVRMIASNNKQLSYNVRASALKAVQLQYQILGLAFVHKAQNIIYNILNEISSTAVIVRLQDAQTKEVIFELDDSLVIKLKESNNAIEIKI